MAHCLSQNSYWKWWFIVDLPTQNGGFSTAMLVNPWCRAIFFSKARLYSCSVAVGTWPSCRCRVISGNFLGNCLNTLRCVSKNSWDWMGLVFRNLWCVFSLVFPDQLKQIPRLIPPSMFCTSAVCAVCMAEVSTAIREKFQWAFSSAAWWDCFGSWRWTDRWPRPVGPRWEHHRMGHFPSPWYWEGPHWGYHGGIV